MTTTALAPPGRWPVAMQAHPRRKNANARCATSSAACSSISISHRLKGDHQMATTTRQTATTTRQATKTITMPPAAEETVPEPVTRRKQADSGRLRLQVERQTKASYAAYEG